MDSKAPFTQTERTGLLSLAQKENPKFQVSAEKGILGGTEVEILGPTDIGTSSMA